MSGYVCACVHVSMCVSGRELFSRYVCQTYCLEETKAAESTNYCALETHTHTQIHTQLFMMKPSVQAC